jgi:CheY-like chemotaxis protein
VAARRLKVLVVDDNRDLLEMLSMLVETAGHDVRKASDGTAALSAVRVFQPDVVLLDVGLPDMSGLEVARALRCDPSTAAVRLVALTGWGQVEDQRETEAAGFDYHLTKPADPDALLEFLAALEV